MRYVENFIQDGWTTFPLPNIARRPAALRDLAAAGAAAEQPVRAAAALYETDKLIREGHPQAGFEATKKFLENYSNLWAQDASRRLASRSTRWSPARTW
jgi:zinc protease